MHPLGLLLYSILAAVPLYGSFAQVDMPSGVTMVEAIAQDCGGLVWFGTNRGLFAHDGFDTFPVGDLPRTYCILSAEDGRDLYLGTEDGLFLLDGRRFSVTRAEGGPGGVRSLRADGDSLWVGGFGGLYSWRGGRFSPHQGLGNEIVYSLLDAGPTLYVGTYDGLYAFDKATETFRTVPLPNPGHRVNIFVNALTMWQDRVLVGTEDGLFSYAPSSGQVAEIPLSRNSVKTFGSDADGNLLCGTDNGLYVLDGKTVRLIRHEAGREDSLGNDIIWSILRDRDGNVWLGTDESVSLTCPRVPLTSIRDLYGSGGGNRFTQILKDRHGRLWLGGTDGLLQADGSKVVWHRVDDPDHPLSHNRIRRIYEDPQGDIWLCTDGSIHILDGRRFRRLDLTDSTQTRNANWAYDILEDRRGRMWVATSLGGVLIKDKMALLSGDHKADSTITLPEGSHGLYASQLAMAADGSVWCLYYNDGLHHFGGPGLPREDSQPSCLYADSDGGVWFAWPGRLFSESGSYALPGLGEITCMGQVGGQIWVAGTERTVAVDLADGRVRQVRTDGLAVRAIWGDDSEVIIGVRDGIIRCSPEELLVKDVPFQVSLTSVTVGSETRWGSDGMSVREGGSLVFGPDATPLSFSFSGGHYGRYEPEAFLWRLAGIDESWNLLPPGGNRVTFNRLRAGKYNLQVAVSDAAGRPSGTLDVPFRIRRHWYLRGWAFLLYLLFLAGSGLWVFHFFRIRGRLRRERAEKDNMLDSLVRPSAFSGPVDFVDLVRRCVEDFRSGLPAGREVALTTNTPGCTLYLDEYRIATAMENILSNAAQHGRGLISVGVDMRGGTVSVSVSDQGPGIAPEDLPHVRERFYRGSSSQGAGTGLYLADVYVQRDGGSLDIQSAAGTKVTMTFPVREASAPDVPSADDRFLSEMTELIEAHLDDNTFNVASLSEQTGLGGKLIYRKIKQLTGLTPVEYLRTLRLRKAAALLREGKLSVSEVMYRVGFTNASYFSKCFQAEFGTTPKNY